VSEPSTPAPVVVVLIVAHGSRNPRAAEEHERFCSLVAEAIGNEPAEQAFGTHPTAPTVDDGPRESAANIGVGGPDVRPAFLELTEPSVATAIERAVRDGATTVKVLPHFLNSGNHVLVDLPAIVDAARSRHPGVEIHHDSH
jgi:sirohydrochlorin ferrochelatase